MVLVPDRAKWQHSCSRQPNAITLSCKSRLPRRPLESGAAAAATNTEWQERTGSRRDAGVQLEPPEGGSAAEPRLGGFCQLVRVVGQRHDCLWLLAGI